MYSHLNTEAAIDFVLPRTHTERELLVRVDRMDVICGQRMNDSNRCYVFQPFGFSHRLGGVRLFDARIKILMHGCQSQHDTQ